MAEYALRLENSTDTRERMRKGDALGLVPGAVSGGRNGLRADGGGEVSEVAGTMTVEVTPFRAWVDGGSSDAQGGYPFVLDATKVLTITDGDAVLSRTDTIVGEVQDDTYDASGSTLASVHVVVGTPGAGAPTLPDSCVALRDVTVPAGLSAGTGGLSGSNIGTDRRAYTAALGGVVPVSGATERDAMGALAGQPVYRLDTGNLEVFNGSTWDTYSAAESDTGWTNIASLGVSWAAGSRAPQYRVIGNRVQLRGILVRSAGAAATCATLAAAARPALQEALIGRVQNATGTLSVAADGSVAVGNYTNGQDLFLDGVSYLTD